MTVRLLIVDDQPLVRTGLRMQLDAQADMSVVGEAGVGRAAVQLARDLHPDIVLMDVRMPVMDGVEATRVLIAEQPPESDRLTRVIMLTTFHDEEAVYAALRAGASGFWLKDARPAALFAAIHDVASGGAAIDPPVARRLLKDFAARPDSRIPPPVAVEDLTRREREVLVLIAHGFSNDDIARHLVLGGATVKTHVGRILMKLGLHDRAQAVATAYQCGLVRPGDHPPAGHS